jgi:PAS domain-containing protein
VAASDILGKGDYLYAVPFYGDSRPVLVNLIDKTEEEIKKFYPEARKVKDTVYSQVFVPRLHQGQGAYVWVKASPLHDQDGRPIGAIETLRDISDWKRAEDALKNIHTRFEEKTRELQLENENLRKELAHYRQLLNDN